MAVTGQQVYDQALALIDEVTNGGAVDTSNPANKTKAIKFLTTLQAELLPSSIAPVVITDLSQNLLLTDRQCLLVLPYGLAAHLSLIDDPATASFLNSRYEELRSKKQAAITPIVDIYDVNAGLR